MFSGAGEFSSIPNKDSNFEKYCSGQFFKNYHNTTGPVAFKKAKNGDQEMIGLWNIFGMHVGKLIHVILFSLAPEAIIIGGSISNSYDFFKDSLFQTINEFPITKVRQNLTIKCTHNQDIAVMGAGALLLDASV